MYQLHNSESSVQKFMLSNLMTIQVIKHIALAYCIQFVTYFFEPRFYYTWNTILGCLL